ncbi:MAG: TlyA family RNA methyltransferase [Lachnospirales bacterium]
MEKYRLDILLSKKLNISREKARKIILDNKVLYNKKPLKSSFKLTDEDFLNIEILESDFLKYVSRGGLKLEKALEEFQIDVKDKIALDVGSSTGGFTHCLIKNGVEKVYAVDTGTLQMEREIAENPKVFLNENTNILDFSCEKVDIIVVDVSFVSTTKLIEKLSTMLKDDGDLVILFKPQFEVGRKFLSKKGVVKDKKVTLKTLGFVLEFYENFSLKVVKHISSPILGGDGNEEFLVHLKRG